VSWLVEVVGERDKPRVEAALASCETLSLRVGASVEPGRFDAASLLLVEEGIVIVSALSAGTRRRLVVALAAAGSVLLPPRRHERLEALADARLAVVSESAYKALLHVPAAGVQLAAALAAQLRDCQASLRPFANPRHVDRIRQKLIQLADSYGKDGSGGVWLSLPLTHEVLAEMVGSTRESVTRAMTQLTREGFVRHERGAYRLTLPPERLES